MEMPLEITMEKLVTSVKLAEGRNDNIKAFGELSIRIIGQEEPLFRGVGFTIREKEFNGKTVYNVVFPAFKAGLKFQTSFVAVQKSMWRDISIMFLTDFHKFTGLGAEDIENLIVTGKHNIVKIGRAHV